MSVRLGDIAPDVDAATTKGDISFHQWLGDDVDVTLIDRNDSFVFGYAKLDVMFGRTAPGAIHLPYRSFAKPGVTFKQEVVTSIDPGARRVTTDKETYDADARLPHRARSAGPLQDHPDHALPHAAPGLQGDG
jgi:hypothetical protein